MKNFTPKQLTPEQETEKEELQREKSFNGLTAKEWASLSKNVWNDVRVIKDYRDTKNKIPYISFHSDLAIWG